ncbi:MAG: non-canonical purine NTP diphosphatase [Bacteroidales bacterium]|nr:non-canonical purine NTP diphosphatase [Bacteroidales bacterium]
MKKLVFATHNSHKTEEVSAVLRGKVELVNLSSLGFHEDIPETSDTLEGNALQKARYVYERFHLDCFADDTGLEVEALNGGPGVYTARFAGPGCDFDSNVAKLLRVLEGVSDRHARFRTVVALILDGREYLFEGVIDGEITTERRGDKGFGYDPVFRPEGYDLTFAQMGADAKNRISHRAIAVRKLTDFLTKEK